MAKFVYVLLDILAVATIEILYQVFKTYTDYLGVSQNQVHRDAPECRLKHYILTYPQQIRLLWLE